MTLLNDEAAFRCVVYVQKSNAKKRGLEFSLTNAQLRILYKGNCHYCGIKPERIRAACGITTKPFIYNGIDRKDNSKGYTLDNCVSCCRSCNSTKSSNLESEMIQPNKWYGNYLTIKPTKNRKNRAILWECLHRGKFGKNQIKEVSSGLLRKEERIQVEIKNTTE